MKKLTFILVNALITMLGGWYLAQFVATLPYEMPHFLDASIRAVLRVTGHQELANTDDIETLAILALVASSTVVVGLIVLVCNIAMRHYVVRKGMPP